MPTSIYLAGYSTGNGNVRKPETLLARANELGATVIDIRMRPGSRVFTQWNKYALSTLIGDKYFWFPQFGNAAVHTGNIEISDYAGGLLRLRSHIRVLGRPVILLCACRSVHQCHRGVLGKMLERENDGSEFRLEEFDWKAPVEPALPIQRALEMELSR